MLIIDLYISEFLTSILHDLECTVSISADLEPEDTLALVSRVLAE